MEKLELLRGLVLQLANEALAIDWSEVSYKKSSLVFKATAFVAVVFFSALLVRLRSKREQSFRQNTGPIAAKRHRPGFFYLVVRGTTWLLLIASCFFLGVTLADPVVVVVNSTQQTESREIIYIDDISSSSGFKLGGTNVARATVSREFKERLIIKRKDKKDRAAYVVFASQSEIWSSFTTSFESLLFSVHMSPLALAPAQAKDMWPGMFVLKPGEFTEHYDGSQTNLHLGLQSAIYLFDKKGLPEITRQMELNPSLKMRSVIITTDGAADADPEPQFIELKKRRIIPYLVFMDPALGPEKQLYGENSPKAGLPSKLLAMVRRYGGQYFLARDRNSVDLISQKLDQLQSIRQTNKVDIKEREVYYLPLSLSCLMALVALFIRFLSAPLWRTV